MRLLLGLVLTLPCWGLVSVVQSKQCSSAAGPTITCVMTSNVVSGNMYVLLLQHGGGNNCSGGAAGVFANTRTSTFTIRSAGQNVSGGQSISCIFTTTLGSSGADTITFTKADSNFPAAMWVFEITVGVGSVTFTASNGVNDFGNPTVTGNMVIIDNDGLLVCGPATNTSTNPWTSATPVGATTSFLVTDGYASASLYKNVAAGTHTCGFSKTTVDARNSIAGLIVSYVGSPANVSRHRSVVMQ